MDKKGPALNRRDFVKLAAASAALFSAAAVPGAQEARQPLKQEQKQEKQSPSPRARRNPNAKLIRVASIQSRANPRVKGLCIDPFNKDFTTQQLNQSIDGWLAHYEDLIAQAAREQCRLAVLPEDFTRIFDSAMFLDDRSIFRNAVKGQTPLVAERLGAAARRHRMHLVACYFANEGDRIYNVADLFAPSGERIGRYRKVHMPQYEMWQVTPGDDFPAFETELGWVGMLICYDQMWPEAAACCAMNGAQLICHPSAAVLKDFYLRQRAFDNQVHYLSATRQESMIAAPNGDLLASGENRDPAVVWADIDLRTATMADENFYEYLYSGIRDHKERHLKFRRQEAYKVLLDKKPPLAAQYPPGGVANTPEEIDRVYQIVKKIRQGDPEYRNRYHWRWL